MLGYTNAAFRLLCAEYGAGLVITEMLDPREIVESPAPATPLFLTGSKIRAIQLCADEPTIVVRALRELFLSVLPDYVELNFSCPHPRIVRRGAGAAMLRRHDDARLVIRRTVEVCREEGTPVGVKLRMGLMDGDRDFLRLAVIAEDEGCSVVTLHGRSAERQFSGDPNWAAIARVRQETRLPVVGNGDVRTAADALDMFNSTGCSGVAVARGAIGRPQVFTQISSVLQGDGGAPNEARFRATVTAILRHAELAIITCGETMGLSDLQPFIRWYLLGFRVPPPIARELATAATYHQLTSLLDDVDPSQFLPDWALRFPRVKSGATWAVC
jgi:nifR3 family TIM-barrel protein